MAKTYTGEENLKMKARKKGRTVLTFICKSAALSKRCRRDGDAAPLAPVLELADSATPSSSDVVRYSSGSDGKVINAIFK